MVHTKATAKSMRDIAFNMLGVEGYWGEPLPPCAPDGGDGLFEVLPAESGHVWEKVDDPVVGFVCRKCGTGMTW